MLHGVYKIMDIPEEEWDEFDNSFKEILVGNILVEITSLVSKEKVDELNSMIRQENSDPGKALREWLGKQKEIQTEGLEKKLQANIVKSSVDYINVLSEEATDEQLAQLTKYLESFKHE